VDNDLHQFERDCRLLRITHEWGWAREPSKNGVRADFMFALYFKKGSDFFFLTG